MPDYEIAFIAENASQRLGEIKNFAQSIDNYFPNDVLTGLNIGLWSLSDTIGFWLVFEKFDQDYIQVFQKWMNNYQIKVLEVMNKPQTERDKLFDEFIFKPDVKFIGGGTPITMVFDAFKTRLKELGKIKNSQEI